MQNSSKLRRIQGWHRLEDIQAADYNDDSTGSDSSANASTNTSSV
jgi:hypothetical protein